MRFRVGVAVPFGLLLVGGGGCGDPVVGGSCSAGLTLCGERCVDTASDHSNCGGCGRGCAGAETCRAGRCEALTCVPGLTPCAGSCVDPMTDVENCGGCGVACAPGERCEAGACVGRCAAGLVECGGDCADVRTDPSNCGVCGRACAADEACQRGSCIADCLPGYTDCHGSCVDVSTDPAHCGGCFRPCAADAVCEGGVCLPGCLPGHVVCARACVDLSSDPDNCGECGVACDTETPCVDGICIRPCPTELVDCGGTCVDPATDRNHCGTCGNRCGDEEACTGGECRIACPEGRHPCGTECVNMSSDPAHCGLCDRACDPGWYCFVGSCLFDCPDGRTPCGSTCADTTRDPDNCGACDHSCPTGICEDSVCSATFPGHVVLIGHNYARLRTAQGRLIGNAVLSTVRRTPVRVAAFVQWAPTGPGTAAYNTDRAVRDVALATGRTWERIEVADVDTLIAALPDADVALFYEQSNATNAELLDAGASLAAPLAAFVRRGGVVVVTDYVTSNSGTWQILDAAGLLSVAGASDTTGTRVTVVAPTDAVAAGVPMTYVAENGSVRFDSAETVQVVSDGTGPVVIHKVITP